MRLPGILCGVGVLFFWLLLVRRTEPMDQRAAWVGWVLALLLLATNTFVIHVRRPITDPLLVFFVAGAIYGAARLALDGGRRWEIWTGRWSGIACCNN